MGRIAKRLLARLGIWRSDDISTVPPELAACEYDCVQKDCDEESFDNCERRLHTAEVLRAEAPEQVSATGGERPAPCVAPPMIANDGTSAPAPDRSAAC